MNAESSLPVQPSDGRIVLDAGLLKALRKTRGLSQDALADLCFSRQVPVSIASIKRAETGKPVLYRTARHLASILDVALDELLPEGALAPDDDEAPTLPAPTAATAAAPPTDALVVAGEGVRYVIQLHIELSSAPEPDGETMHDIAGVAGQFGGRVDSIDGSRVTCVFGLPQAYRSDAERAARCALALARRLVVHGGRAMALRLVRWQDGDGSDSPLDRAVPDLRQYGSSQFSTPPVYVARNLSAQLQQRFGIAQAAHRFPGYLELGEPLDAGTARTPLVGRVVETRQFEVIAASATEMQSGQLVYLRGPAGVGKSRLAQECAQIARAAGFRCHSAEVQDTGADSWRAPLEQLARNLFGMHAGETDEDAIDATMAELHLPRDWTIFYRALTGARMTSDQLTVYAAMSHAVRDQGIATALNTLILKMALAGPLLLTIEDVHWGDSYLFDALGGLVALSREAPLVWVLTSRVEHDPLDSALRPHLFDLPVAVFDLAPMNPRDALALTEQFPDLDETYRRRCVERAQGNALFLTQLLASPDNNLPDSLKHLIQARLDTLPPLHRRALRTAAVLGNRWELELLRDAIDDASYEPEGAGRNLLVRRVAPGVYAFVHDLVMHCIYESIDAGQLRRLHRGVAALYRERDPAAAAQHLYRAEDTGAFDMMLRAIRDKLTAHQYEDALELTAQCSAADSTRYSSFTLALLQSQATAGMGRIAQARERYEHALMLAGRPQEKIDAVIGLAGTLNILDELDEEERLIDETLPLARSINADAALGKLLYLKGNIYFPRGNYTECRRHHEDAVRHARASGTTETEARALSGMGDSYYAQGRMQKAYEVFGQCIAMCEEHRLVGIEASNRSALGSTRIYLGQPDDAVADALESAAIARKVGNRRAEVFARMTAGWVLTATGQVDRATEEVETSLDMARAIGAARFEGFLMESQARLAWLRGERGEAARIIHDAAEFVERQKLQRFIGPWVLGTLALFTSDATTRKKALLRGASQLTQDSLAHNAYRFYVNAAEAALLDGDTVTAEFYAEQLAASAGPEPCRWVDHHTALIAAYARWSGQPSAEARAALASLRADGRRFGFAQATPRLFEHLADI